MAGKYYAVKRGRTPGIYHTWEDCKKQTAGFSGAIYKSFQTAAEAAVFMGWGSLEDSCEIKNVGEKCALTAYVDGSFNSMTNVYGSGVVILNGETEICLSDSGDDEEMAKMRNVAGEILAAKLAMEYACEKGYPSVEIVHDYEGIARWCTGEWKTNKAGTQAYKKEYEFYKDKIKIVFTKVKGHSGDKYNDMADEVAKRAAGIL